MKTFVMWISIALNIVLIVWCNLNTSFINENKEKIEQLEQKLPENKVDTVFIINYYQQSKKK